MQKVIAHGEIYNVIVHAEIHDVIVSDCSLTPIHPFSSISWREHVNCQWDDSEFHPVLHADMDLYSASSLKQHVAPLGHIILIPKPTSLCSLSLMLRA